MFQLEAPNVSVMLTGSRWIVYPIVQNITVSGLRYRIFPLWRAHMHTWTEVQSVLIIVRGAKDEIEGEDHRFDGGGQDDCGRNGLRSFQVPNTFS